MEFYLSEDYVDTTQRRNELLASLRLNLVSLFSHSYCWTVSISDKAIIKCKELVPVCSNPRKTLISWGCMTPTQQMNWLKMYYFPEVFRGEYYAAFWELNSKGNIHCHLIMQATGDMDFWVHSMRKYCKQCSKIHEITLGKKEAFLHTNYIHTWFEKGLQSWVEYITKDYVKNGKEMTPYLDHSEIINFEQYNI